MTQHAVRVLSEMARNESGMVFPMTANAVDCAWDGVRVKAGIPTMQFRDLRHVAATDFARRGFNSHHLMKVLGHKTITMAQTYVNLVSQDVLDVMDRTVLGVANIRDGDAGKGDLAVALCFLLCWCRAYLFFITRFVGMAVVAAFFMIWPLRLRL